MKPEIIKKIEKMNNTIDLDNLITTILEAEYPNDDRIYNESFSETADRIQSENEKLAFILRAAEKKWFELED